MSQRCTGSWYSRLPHSVHKEFNLDFPLYTGAVQRSECVASSSAILSVASSLWWDICCLLAPPSAGDEQTWHRVASVHSSNPFWDFHGMDDSIITTCLSSCWTRFQLNYSVLAELIFALKSFPNGKLNKPFIYGGYRSRSLKTLMSYKKFLVFQSSCIVHCSLGSQTSKSCIHLLNAESRCYRCSAVSIYTFSI